MIIPITTYGAVATSLRSNAQFQEQDVELRKAVRMAIHAPSSIRNDYVEREGGIPPSKTLSLRLARKYLLNENRSAGLKELIRRSDGNSQVGTILHKIHELFTA